MQPFPGVRLPVLPCLICILHECGYHAGPAESSRFLRIMQPARLLTCRLLTNKTGICYAAYSLQATKAMSGTVLKTNWNHNWKPLYLFFLSCMLYFFTFSFLSFFPFGIVLQAVLPMHLCLIRSGSFCKISLKLTIDELYLFSFLGYCFLGKLYLLGCMCIFLNTFFMHLETRNRGLVLQEEIGFFHISGMHT